MKNILFIYLLICISGCIERPSDQGIKTLLGSDYRLFRNTPAWGLAQAVEDEDVDKIKKIVREEKVDIDYQEPKFGKTLLMLTVLNEQSNSCKALLELGADPNKKDNYNGSSATIYAAEINGITDDNTKFLKLLLKHGASPNGEVVDRQNTLKNIPLLAACKNFNKVISPIVKVKILVEAGANINYGKEFGHSALKVAYIPEHWDVILYLLQKGADYKVPIFNREGKDYYLWDELRGVLLPLDSKEYRQKMEIVEFLKQKGIDYRKLPIPDHAVKEAKEMYPDSWKEYLEKY